MTTHLRRHIEQAELLYPEQLDNALRRQEIYGGSLDTALLELELVDAPTLARWLEQACGLQLAPASLLSRRSGRPWDALDPELMSTAWALPLDRADGRLQIAVHPDLPDDRLGQLYRTRPGLQPMVAPECCLEALRAEWQGSVVPQRYAVLSVAYIGAMRRAAAGDAPSTGDTQPPRAQRNNSTVRYRWDESDPSSLVPDERVTASPIPEPPPSAVEDDELEASIPPLARMPEDTPVPAPPPSREDTAVGPAPEPPEMPPPPIVPMLTKDRGGPARPPIPDAIVTDGPGAGPLPLTDGPDFHQPIVDLPPDDPSLDPPPRRGKPTGETEVIDIPVGHDPRPRARFTAKGTLIDGGDPAASFDDADLVRRMAGARSVLTDVRSRDAAIEAIVLGAMAVSPRVAVFRVRGAELVGLSTPRSRLGDIGGTVVPMHEGTPIADAVAEGSYQGRLEDPDLALALSRATDPPCLLRRIDVGNRPVLVLYLDHASRDFVPAEVEQIDELCAEAGAALEAIVRLRRTEKRGPSPGPGHDAATPEALGTGPHGHWQPSDRVRAAYGPEPLPPTTNVTADAGSGTVVAEVPPSDSEPVPVRTSLPAEERVPQSGPEPAAGFGVAPTATEAAPQPEPALDRVDRTEVAPRPVFTPPFAPAADPPSAPPTDAPAEPAPEPPFEPYDAPEVVPPADAPVSADHTSTDVAHDRPQPDPEPGPIDGEDDVDDPRRTEEIAPGLEVARVTDPPSEAQHAAPEADAALARLTVHSSPPPPPLPPPPPMPEDSADDPPMQASGARRIPEPSTLTGLPPLDETETETEDEDEDEGEANRDGSRGGNEADEPGSDPDRDAAPRIPDSLRDGLPTESADIEIIPLASPIDQPTMRGHIELDSEDWLGEPDASESMLGRIDAELSAIAAGEGSMERLVREGDAALAALAARLPGPLEVLRRDLRALPPPAAHGPLIRAAIAAGPPIVPHLLELLHHPNPDVRFYAAYLFQELRDDRCTGMLATLAFDVSGDVRVIAMRVLETYSRAEHFALGCTYVRARLDSEDRSERLYAARAVGTLRDVLAIGRLIELLASKDRFIQEAAIESLCSITGQQLGLKPHRWKSWYVDNRERHRIEWIIDSLRHKDMPVRQWAAHELSRITGHRIPFSPVADKRARESAVRAWTEWWNAEGKARLGVGRVRH